MDWIIEILNQFENPQLQRIWLNISLVVFFVFGFFEGLNRIFDLVKNVNDLKKKKNEKMQFFS